MFPPVSAIVLLLGMAVAGCRSAPRSAEERGARVFARSCASCHGPAGRPSRPIGLAAMPRDLSDPRLYQLRSDTELKAVIRDGKGAMPAFGALLADEDLTLLIAYLHTLAKPQ